MQSSNGLKQAFKDVGIFDEASLSTMALLEAGSVLRKYKKGEHVFHDKDEINTLYVLVSGLVSIYKINSLGEKKIIFIYGSGNILSEVIVQDMTASTSCEVQEDAFILCIPRLLFLQAMEGDFGLTKIVLGAGAVKVRRLYRQLKNTSNSLRGDKRIAAKLWKLSNDYGKPCDGGVMIDMEISITYLADMVGSKRETVSRQVKLLVEQGLVIMRNGRFVIPDKNRLGKFFKSN